MTNTLTLDAVPHNAPLVLGPLSPVEVLLLDVTPTGIAYVFDPIKHPHGFHGHFIPTHQLHQLAIGDVFHTKSGKVFQVEKHSDKGVKVKTVDKKTGALKGGYTVLPHAQDVELIQPAKAVGTQHPIGELPPGTYVTTAKGKKFKIKGHGKWTTILPVDDAGTVKGKHTVVPMTTVVTIHHPSETADITPEMAKEVNALGEQHKYATLAGGWIQQIGNDDLSVADQNQIHQFAKVKAEHYAKLHPDWSTKQLWAQSYADAYADVVGDSGDDSAHALWDYLKTGEIGGEGPPPEDTGALVPAKNLQPGDKIKAAPGKSISDFSSGTPWVVNGPSHDGQHWSLTNEEGWASTTIPMDDTLVQHVGYAPIGGDSEAGAEVAAMNAAAEWLKGADVSPGHISTIHTLAEANFEKVDAQHDPGNNLDFKWGLAYAAAFGHWHQEYGLESPATANNELHEVVSTAVLESMQGKPSLAKQPTVDDNVAQAAHDAAEKWLAVVYTPEETSAVHQAATMSYAKIAASGNLPDDAWSDWGTAYGAAYKQVFYPNTPYADVPEGSKKEQAELIKAVEGATKPPEQKIHDAAAVALVQLGYGPKTVQGIQNAATDFYNTNPPIATIAQSDKALAWATAYAHAFHNFDPGGGPPSNEEKAKLWVATTGAAHPLEDQLAPPASQDPLSGAIDNALSDISAQQAAQAAEIAKKTQDQLPTKFPKAIPKVYEDGVGPNTKIVIRHYLSPYSSDAAIVRVAPDGHEQLLEYHNSIGLSDSRRAARQHAGAHEAIEEQTRTNSPVLEQPFQAGGFLIRPNGSTMRILQLQPDGKLETRGGYWTTEADGSHKWHYYGPSYGTQIVDPQHDAVMFLPDAQSVPVGHDEIRKKARLFLEQHGAYQDKLDKVVKKGNPAKYSEYLKGGWDPEQLIGQDPKVGIAAMKVHGYLEIKPRQQGQVRLINKFGARLNFQVEGGKVTAVDQPKLAKLEIDGTAQDFHQQLQEILDTGGDLSGMDPRTTGTPEAATSFVRGLLYDMALGKKNGVKQGGSKVKSDEAYRQELEASGDIPNLEVYRPEAEQNAPLLTIRVTGAKEALAEATDPRYSPMADLPEGGTGYAYELNHPENLSKEERALLWSVLKRRGMAQLALERDKGDLVHAVQMLEADRLGGKLDVPAPEGSPFATMREYVDINTNHWGPAADDAVLKHQNAIYEAMKQLQRNEVQQAIDELRAEEGTTKEATEDYQLPTWADVEFRPQSFEEIDNLAASAGQREVPSFYNGGVFQDAVLLHRTGRTTGRVAYHMDGSTIQRLQMAGAQEQGNTDSSINKLTGSYPIYAGRSYFLDDGGGKTIEYVYHAQPGGKNGGAPTSQRGVLRVTGYTPQEAAQRLQQLGLLGDLEPTVPYDAAMRGPRRYGTIDAMHPAYVRGEAPLPKAKQLLVHGIQHSEAIFDIIKGGGLASIADRWRRGIKKFGVSPSGDMRSGIDHAVFTNYGGSAVGAGASIRILLRPSAYLRRDIVLSQTDYGGSPTRYDSYRGWLHKLQKEVGEPETNLYAPVSPAVRQRYLTGASLTGAAEFNIGPAIPVEDWEVIAVGYASLRAKVNELLDQMLASGEIKSKPKVVSTAEISSHQRKVNMA